MIILLHTRYQPLQQVQAFSLSCLTAENFKGQDIYREDFNFKFFTIQVNVKGKYGTDEQENSEKSQLGGQMNIQAGMISVSQWQMVV